MYSVVLMAALTTSVDLPDRGGCRGGGGCQGGCYGGGGRGGRRGGGCCGCYGGCMGMGMGYGGCMGMSMGGGCMGMSMGGHGCYGGGMMLQQQSSSGEKIQKTPKQSNKEQGMLAAPATIVVELPADAKLRIDNEATTSIGGNRIFESPVLNPGKEYQYTLTAEFVRDGKSIKAEKVVTVRAGQTTPVTLTLPQAGVAQR